MPNWCNNSITVEGPVDKIRELWEKATADGTNDTGLLDAMCAMHRELNETVADGSEGTNWYNWRVENWGTKWDVSSEGLEFIDNGEGRAMITGWFDSAWAPPIGAYEQFCEANDDVNIEASYFEPGMDFAGFWTTEGGEEHLEDLHSEYEKPEEMQDELFRRLDEEYDLSSQFAEWDDM